jgi:hypothetical protein
MLNFSKAASKNKDRAGPKHMTQFPERMPRTKKEVDDEVMVMTPSGKAFWFITSIEYQKS